MVISVKVSFPHTETPKDYKSQPFNYPVAGGVQNSLYWAAVFVHPFVIKSHPFPLPQTISSVNPVFTFYIFIFVL